MSHSVRNCSEPENVSNTWLAALPEAKIGVGRLQTLQPPSFSGAHLPDYHWDSWYVCQNKANRWAVVADVYSGSFEATSERYGSKYGEAQCKWGSLYLVRFCQLCKKRQKPVASGCMYAPPGGGLSNHNNRVPDFPSKFCVSSQLSVQWRPFEFVLLPHQSSYWKNCVVIFILEGGVV